jgi:hypothetical protein
MRAKSAVLPPEHEPLLKALGEARSAVTTLQDFLVVAHGQADDPEMVRQRIRYCLRLCEGAVRTLDLENPPCQRQS